MKKDKYTKLSFSIIIIFSLIVLTLTTIHHVSGDACWHLSVSKFISRENKIPLHEPLGRDEPFWAPPLFHFIASALYSLTKSDFLIKFIPPISSILTLMFTFFIAKKLWNSRIAFYTVFFLSFIPIFIDYSVLSYVEGLLMFLLVLSIYFAINDRLILSSISFGLAILTKYNAVFLFPLLLYIFFRKNNFKVKKSLKDFIRVTLVPLVIYFPWFIRNYIKLGNPSWPYLNFVFNGYEKLSYSSIDFSRFFSFDIIIYTFLGFFGVPDGDPRNLMFFSMPFIKILISIWLIGCIIYLLPLLFQKKDKKIGFLIIWIIPIILLFAIYLINVGFSISRIILPAFPALAILWGLGFNNLLEKLNKKKMIKKSIWILLILIVIGFTATEFIKFKLAADSWNSYEEDFVWVRANTPSDTTILAGGQCLNYNLDRNTLDPYKENIARTDYAWINQEFKLDAKSLLTHEVMTEIKQNGQLVYDNKRTGTMIFKID